MPDISMTVDETLELDEIIQEWSRTDSNIDLNGDESSFDISGIQTKTSVLDPQETGNYTITINGQDLSVEVTGSYTIPDLGDYQWPVNEGTGTTLNPSVGSVSATTDGSWATESGPVGDNYLVLSDSQSVTTDSDVGSVQQMTVFGWIRPQLSSWGNFNHTFANNQDFNNNEDGWSVNDGGSEGVINTGVGGGSRGSGISDIQFVNTGVWGFFALFQDGSQQKVITWDNSNELEDTGFVDVGSTPTNQNDSLLWGLGEYGNATMDIGIHGKANALLSKDDLTTFWKSTQR